MARWYLDRKFLIGVVAVPLAAAAIQAWRSSPTVGQETTDSPGSSTTNQEMRESPGAVQATGDVTINQSDPEVAESLERIERSQLEAKRKLDEIEAKLATDRSNSIQTRDLERRALVYVDDQGGVAARDPASAFDVDWAGIRVIRRPENKLWVIFPRIEVTAVNGARFSFRAIGIGMRAVPGTEMGVIRVDRAGIVARVVSADGGGVAIEVGLRRL